MFFTYSIYLLIFLSSCFINYQKMDVKISSNDYGFLYSSFSLVEFCFMYFEALVFITLSFFLFFVFFLATPCSLWDLSSPTRDWTQAMEVKVPSPNHWTVREFPHTLDCYVFLINCLFIAVKDPYLWLYSLFWGLFDWY